MDKNRLMRNMALVVATAGMLGLARWPSVDPQVLRPEAEPPAPADWGRIPERSASVSLRTPTAADDAPGEAPALEAGPTDARANDRDWCHVNDFWTSEVTGLYTMSSAEVSGTTNLTGDSSIKLIELSVSSADENQEELRRVMEGSGKGPEQRK